MSSLWYTPLHSEHVLATASGSTAASNSLAVASFSARAIAFLDKLWTLSFRPQIGPWLDRSPVAEAPSGHLTSEGR